MNLVISRVNSVKPFFYYFWSFHHEQKACSRCRHWCCWPNRLRLVVSYRFRRNVGQRPARDLAIAGNSRRKSPKRAQGRDDGTRRLRIPIARRHGSAFRPHDCIQRHRLRFIGWFTSTRPWDGACGIACHQWRYLYGARQGIECRGFARRESIGSRQPSQYQRLHRHEVCA